MSTSLVLLIGRILMAFIFIMAGISKFGSIAGTAGYIGSVGLPAPTILAWAAAVFETLAGLALLAGFRTRETAWALAAFCVFTGFMFHFQPADQMQMISFMKNLAMAGGLMAFTITGAGAWSVDGRRG